MRRLEQIDLWILTFVDLRLIVYDLQTALQKFGNRRTNWEKGTTFQGIETPSQSRFVEYFDKIRKEHGGQLPPKRTLRLKRVIIRSINGKLTLFERHKQIANEAILIHVYQQINNCEKVWETRTAATFPWTFTSFQQKMPLHRAHSLPIWIVK